MFVKGPRRFTNIEKRCMMYLTSKKCPFCNYQLMKNKNGDQICSNNKCDYGTMDTSYYERRTI